MPTLCTNPTKEATCVWIIKMKCYYYFLKFLVDASPTVVYLEMMSLN